MSTCRDCSKHPRKLCDVHALQNNLHDETDDLRHLLLDVDAALSNPFSPFAGEVRTRVRRYLDAQRTE